jgi:hypothetical protein
LLYVAKENNPPSIARGSEDETTGNATPNKINNEDESNDMIMTTPPNMDVLLMSTNTVSEEKGNETEEVEAVQARDVEMLDAGKMLQNELTTNALGKVS